jgi:CHAD domain-containing protein
MAFKLKAGESVRKGIRRIARKQIDAALEHLTASRSESRDESVHEARKSFKKVRAVLRFVRPVIGQCVYREENIRFRDAGRPLTEVRDARILIETLDGLHERFGEHISDRSFSDVRKALQANLRAVRKRVLDKEDALAAVAGTVRQARGHLEDWADVPNKWSSLGKGLTDVYRRAGEAHAAAAADATVEKLHEWRKQAKYLRYQLEILCPLWRERLEELAGEADLMQQLLGDDHDLAVLRQMLTDDPEPYGDRDDAEVLLALIDRRRAELQEEAMPLGERFFQDSPEDFGARLKGYWKTWRTQTAVM